MVTRSSVKEKDTHKKNSSTKKSKDLEKTSVVEKSIEGNCYSSVITKSTNPKVVVQTESIQEDKCDSQYQCHYCKHKFIISLCLIVMGIIVLATFFIALKTYYIINMNHPCPMHSGFIQ